MADRTTRAKIRRWRQYLADERAEEQVYRDLASRASGEDREILLALAEAESRHQAHWERLLGDRAGRPLRPSLSSQVLSFFARRLGSVFVLAVMQRAEARSPYDGDSDATEEMAADEQIHSEVVRGLAARGRLRLAGTFRAAVFGANDGLVSNMALVMGIGAAGAPATLVLLTGIAGLLSGALSMGAGEFVSVRSQRELLAATTPSNAAQQAIAYLDVDANELALVYRARGMSPAEAEARAAQVFREALGDQPAIDDAAVDLAGVDDHEAVGGAWSAALSSFLFFASGAIVPVLPFLFGLTGVTATVVALVLVGIALLITGATVGILSGTSPWRRALRQLLIGYGAALVTQILGSLFGVAIGG